MVVSQLMVTFVLPRQAAQPHRCTTTTNGSHQRQLRTSNNIKSIAVHGEHFPTSVGSRTLLAPIQNRLLS